MGAKPLQTLKDKNINSAKVNKSMIKRAMMLAGLTMACRLSKENCSEVRRTYWRIAEANAESSIPLAMSSSEKPGISSNTTVQFGKVRAMVDDCWP